MPRVPRPVLLTALVFLLLPCVVLPGLLALMASEGGTARLAAFAAERAPGRVEWQALEGSLLGSLRLRGLAVEQPGLSLRAASATVEWRPRALLRGNLLIDALTLTDATLQLDDTAETEPSALLQLETLPHPSTLQLPLNLALAGVELRELRVLQGDTPLPTIERATLEGTLSGDRLTLAQLSVQLADATAQLSGSARLQDALPFELQIDAETRLPPTGSRADDATLAVALTLDGRIDWGATLATTLDYRLALRGLDALAPELPPALSGAGGIAARLGNEALTLEDASLALEDAALELGLRGVLRDLTAAMPAVEGQLAWRGARWPLESAPAMVESPEGHIDIRGSAEGYALELALALAGPDLPASEWQGSAHGDRRSLTLDRLQGELLGGTLVLAGPLAWDPRPRWDLTLETRDIDPGTLLPELAGALNATLATQGQLAVQGEPQATVSIASLGASVLGTPIALQGDVRLRGTAATLQEVVLSSGGNRVSVSGEASEERLDLDWTLSVPDPGRFLPGAAGQIEGRGRVAGSLRTPRLQASLRGSALAFDGIGADTLDLNLTAGLANDAPLDLTLAASGIRDGAEPLLETLTLKALGSTDAHRLDADVQAPAGSLRLGARGALSLASQSWRGELTDLLAEAVTAGRWQLDSAAALSLAADSARLDRACLVGGDSAGTLCLAGAWQAAGDITADIDLDGLPLALLSPSVSGSLSGTLDGSMTTGDALVAEGRLRLGPGEILLPEGLEKTALAHGGGTVDLSVDDTGLSATVDLVAPEDGRVIAAVALPALTTLPPAPEQPLAGSLDATLPDLAIVAALVDGLGSSAGRLRASLQLDGTLDAPLLRGEARLESGALTLPAAGLELADITLRAADDPARPGILALSGGLRSGPGTLTLGGSIDPARTAAQLTLDGERLQVFDTADARVLLSPALEAQWSDDTLRLRGALAVPEARITPRLRVSAAAAEEPGAGGLEEGTVILPSPDVVIVGEEETASGPMRELDAPFRIDAAVDLRLGEAVRVNAAGLITRVAGALNFSLDPAQRELTPRARGVISLVDGTFRSFGQDLDIETGQFVFGDVPVTEPELYLRAVRWIDNDPGVTAAGVVVTGPVASPRLELFSRPQLETSAIQSYLLTGSAAGGGERVISFGTYLSERLYVGYGYNLLEETSEFDAVFSVTPRYGLGADVGEADSNFNLTFTVER